MNYFKFFLIFLIFNFCFNIYSEEQSLSNVNYSYNYISDSSFFHTAALQFANHRRNLLYSYLNEQDIAWDYGGSVLYIKGFNAIDNFYGERVLLMIGRKFSPNFYLDISLGINNYYNYSQEKNFIALASESKATFVLSEILSGFIGIAKDRAYVFSVQPGSIADGLLATKLFGLLTVRYHEDWMSRITEDYLFINDGNQKSVTNLSLLYGLSTSTPWIWIGLGLEYTGYTYSTTNYWSPTGFLGYGTRMEAEFFIIDEFFSVNLNFDYNRIYDNDTKTEGNGFNLSSKLTLGNRNDHNVSIYYNRIDSSQNGNNWISNEFGLSLNITI